MPSRWVCCNLLSLMIFPLLWMEKYNRPDTIGKAVRLTRSSSPSRRVWGMKSKCPGGRLLPADFHRMKYGLPMSGPVLLKKLYDATEKCLKCGTGGNINASCTDHCRN